MQATPVIGLRPMAGRRGPCPTTAVATASVNLFAIRSKRSRTGTLGAVLALGGVRSTGNGAPRIKRFFASAQNDRRVECLHTNRFPHPADRNLDGASQDSGPRAGFHMCL
jgi:type IV secretory pathway TrbL component